MSEQKLIDFDLTEAQLDEITGTSKVIEEQKKLYDQQMEAYRLNHA